MRIIGIGLIAIMLAFSPAAALEDREEVYLIESFEALAEFSRLVSEGEGAFTGEVRLTRDIEAVGAFRPIGDEAHMFMGTFDGQGHTMSGLQIDGTGDFSGLFGFVGRDGAVCRLTLENVLVSGERYTGAVAGFSSGRIVDCVVTGGRVIGRSEYEYGTATGGIVGLTDGTVDRCVNLNASVYGGRYTGGIAGSLCAGSMERCMSSGRVISPCDGEALVGGVVGAVQSGGAVKRCIGLGNVFAQRAFDAGGVAGGLFSGSMTKCIFAGEVSGMEPGAVAGFAAQRAQIMACFFDSNCPVGVGEGKQDGTLRLPRRGNVRMNAERLMYLTGEGK